MKKQTSLLLTLLAFAACKSETPRLDQTPPDSVAAAPTTEPTPNPEPEPSDSVAPIGSWKISTLGYGPLHAGMPVSDVRKLLPKLNAPADAETSECTYARSSSLPVGVVLMLAKGSLARVEVISGQVQSDLGARIGDTESQIKLLYGNAVTVSPHKYTDGHYLTVRSPADSSRRIVFETDGAKVLRYRAGRTPEVGYVEGCS